MTATPDRKRRILYLHGFASGPTSSKARFFRDRFAECGQKLEILALAEGDFELLTVSGQLRIIERLAEGEPVSLIGSSLGAYLAALYASKHSEVQRLVLLAPAFDLAARWPERIGAEGMLNWARTRKLEVFHYAENRPARLDYAFYEDVYKHAAEPDFTQPALLIHGTRDDVVPITASEKYAKAHPNTVLHVLDSGHELTDVLDRIWPLTRDFLAV